MELSPFWSIIVIILAYIIGMAHAAWIFQVRAMRAGYKFDDKLFLVPLEQNKPSEATNEQA
jgi:hypothetical protein